MQSVLKGGGPPGEATVALLCRWTATERCSCRHHGHGEADAYMAMHIPGGGVRCMCWVRCSLAVANIILHPQAFIRSRVLLQYDN